ncbi:MULTISPECIES: 3-isopropylmalate dehydratase small subunit [Cytobacillus]|uniref:3-isopropylmalate dehydratase small subunit n=1 Tax=Cytobacillus oceanisediminis 2691 TaxID=1196031 RepID=A0A169FPJ2_9BACI|nr:3-isopropylmalate dehydratase small subunit [Cytobacillus oceanisediminis]EFV76218.1 3-isopropylmalate dehydratase [Bacillus sp. 2_A_57_CT2]MCS0826016.1 3-isopropylmalate dehydratase small subunit [Cytobacillus firmus]AND40131.1 3-isopropylmalate dehydratase small subunit [Cytobacillus oceanisediminis 2691]MBU8728580.1 3-isopropylmalate dehydratase small subunit [Cytobacillus oceanisediminis]MBU8769058.1 3-isopropylmalate dehydratase small subunit [Cytobacillus oceanisediminis]
MKSFTRFTGIVAPLDAANVDTDAIIPKQFLKRIERTGFGEFLFYEWRYEDGREKPDFILNREPYRNAPILLARKNFGCGSSREHAPWAIAEYGIRVILASSFADIFYNNCFKNGILPIVLPEKDIEVLFQKSNESPGYQLSVDLENQRIEDSFGYMVEFDIVSYRKDQLLKGLDEIGATLQSAELIDSYESAHKIFYKLEV